MQHVIRKYCQTICILQHESCAWDAFSSKGKAKVDPPMAAAEKGEGSLRSPDLNIVEQLWGDLQFAQGNQKIDRNWRHIAKKNHSYNT